MTHAAGARFVMGVNPIAAAIMQTPGEAGADIPVLYGGSVNPGNAEELIVQPSIDGLFTGRAAWQADKFNKLIRDAVIAYKTSHS